MTRPTSRRGAIATLAAFAAGGLVAASAAAAPAQPAIVGAKASTAVAATTPTCRGEQLPAFDGAVPDAELTELFTAYANDNSRLDDWTGADGTYSVGLPTGKTVWVFSDTFLGRVNDDGSRPPVIGEGGDTPFLNNTFVVQDGDQLRTVYGGSADEPAALMPPADANHWFWAGDAHAVGSGLIEATYQEYERFGPGAWDWRWHRNVVARYAVGRLSTPISVDDLPSGAGVAWASAIRHVGAYTYVYGVEDHGSVKYMHIARVRGASLAGQWEFRTADGDWSRDEADSARVMDGVGNEYSVSPLGTGYVLVTHDTTEALSANIVAYYSCSPAGPFTGKTLVYTTPETGASGSYGSPNIFTYNAHAHPHIDRDGDLVVSYNVNTFVNTDHYADASIYRPRFVRLSFDD